MANVTPRADLKDYFKKFAKPTQEQFWAVFDSFYHNNDGCVIRYPTTAEIEAGKKTFSVLIHETQVEIPKSGNYAGSMQDLKDLIDDISSLSGYKNMVLMRRPSNETNTIAVGDMIMGFWTDTYWFKGTYNGGDAEVLDSYTILDYIDYNE